MGHYFALVVSDEPSSYEINALMAPYYQGTDGIPGDFLEFIEDECEDFDETAGRYGYWTNAYGYWDWFEIGGGYANILSTRDGTQRSQCQLVDFAKLADNGMVAPHALVDEDGWHDWSDSPLVEAETTFQDYLKNLKSFYPNAWLSVIDYHM